MGNVTFAYMYVERVKRPGFTVDNKVSRSVKVQKLLKLGRVCT